MLKDFEKRRIERSFFYIGVGGMATLITLYGLYLAITYIDLVWFPRLAMIAAGICVFGTITKRIMED